MDPANAAAASSRWGTEVAKSTEPALPAFVGSGAGELVAVRPGGGNAPCALPYIYERCGAGRL